MARGSFEHGMFVSGLCKTAGPEKGGLQMKEECILVADRLEPRYIAEDEISRDGGQWPEYCRTLVVCVDSFENGLAEGRLHSFCLPAPRPFHSLDQLLFSMEEVLNESRLAEPWNITRTLNGRRARKRKKGPLPEVSRGSAPVAAWDFHALRPRRGKLASFYLRVYSRQNASMQGILIRAGDRDSATAFRSALELIHIFRRALDHSGKGVIPMEPHIFPEGGKRADEQARRKTREQLR